MKQNAVRIISVNQQSSYGFYKIYYQQNCKPTLNKITQKLWKYQLNQLIKPKDIHIQP